ncbi:lysozyme [Halomonas organivorans]|uniref:Lysozyme n=1 Tax=Halomonas organivorans TaxID=257772 RepID=A0A7W5C0N3_9GAMM|nr:lysozyme [Halomonas organivorans]MBB3142208.1 lysozyme [Halomonas organivorans]
MALAAIIVPQFEGTELGSYRDAVGVWTVCTGHTATAGPGQHKTPAECRELLESDLGVALDAVDRSVKVEIAPATRAALVSFTFNLGAGALRRSTLLEKLNAGDIVGACNELPRWIYAGGQRLRGLARRRAAERDLCLEGVNDDGTADTGAAVADDGGDGSDSWFDLATG